MTTPRWAHTTTISKGHADDAPVMRATLEALRDVANRDARLEGLRVVGTPDVTREPLVLVEDWWRDDNNQPQDELVSEHVARFHGSTAPVTAYFVRLEWETVRDA